MVNLPPIRVPQNLPPIRVPQNPPPIRVPQVSHLRPGTGAGATKESSQATDGFTLLELMIVMAIIGILAAVAIPSFVANVKHAKEAVLREDLHTMRGAIDSFTYDKQKAPTDGNDLVQSGYLKTMPKDPFTNRTDTWIFDQSSTYTNIDETQSGGIDDVHSGSQQVSSEGTGYNTW